MPESGAYGSVRGALSNERPYRDPESMCHRNPRNPEVRRRFRREHKMRSASFRSGAAAFISSSFRGEHYSCVEFNIIKFVIGSYFGPRVSGNVLSSLRWS